jgi:tight adherence protein C
MLLLIALLTFVAVMLLVNYLARPRINPVRRRILDGNVNDLPRQRSSAGGAGRRLLRPAMDRLGRSVGQLLPGNMLRHLDALLLQAGEPMSLAAFLAIWLVVSAAAVLLVFWAFSLLAWLGTLFLTLAGSLVLIYAIGLPYLLLRRRAGKRKKAVERALPDALDLLLTCVEAGLGVDAAFALVAQRSQGPLSERLNEYLKYVGLGRTRREALEDVARRSGVEGLNRLANVVAQATVVGTSLGDVLRIQASELRAQRRLKAQETAAKAPIWMTIPLALCFMPAMGAVIVIPSLLHLIDSIKGLGLA